jgi:hypothetical protein
VTKPAPSIPLVPDGAEFSFGDSPFHVKGVLYQGTQTYFTKQVPGGLPALLDAIDQPPLREFIAQKFLASSRYDVMPVHALIEYESRAVGQDVATYLRARSSWQAAQDIHGVYRVMLRLASPERVMQRLPRLLIQMFDFMSADLEETGAGERLVSFAGVPRPLETWVRVAFGVYTETAITLAGAKGASVSFLDSSPDGVRAGVPLLRLRLRVAWT